LFFEGAKIGKSIEYKAKVVENISGKWKLLVIFETLDK